MTPLEFRKEALKATLKTLDRPPEEWITFNDKLNTKVVDATNALLKVDLIEGELPMLECELKNSYLLITDRRVVSIIGEKFDELFYEDIDKMLGDQAKRTQRLRNGTYPKTSKYGIKKKDGSKFQFILDSYYPAYIARILIYNISSYKKWGKWYLNPSLKYRK